MQGCGLVEEEYMARRQEYVFYLEERGEGGMVLLCWWRGVVRVFVDGEC